MASLGKLRRWQASIIVSLTALLTACFAAWFTTLSASDKAAWTSAIGAWVSGIGAFAAAWAALDIAARQARREVAKERRIALAIRPALIADLKAMRDLMTDLHARAVKLVGTKGLLTDEPTMQVFRMVSSIKLPAFDRFKDQLPFLGPDSAPEVIAVYAKLVRLYELNRGYSLEGGALPTGLRIENLRDGAYAQIAPISRAIDLLEGNDV